jgi:hypothetical protein
MRSFGRLPRCEIVMSYPGVIHTTHAQPGPAGVPHPPLFAMAERFSRGARADRLPSFHDGIH